MGESEEKPAQKRCNTCKCWRAFGEFLGPKADKVYLLCNKCRTFRRKANERCSESPLSKAVTIERQRRTDEIERLTRDNDAAHKEIKILTASLNVWKAERPQERAAFRELEQEYAKLQGRYAQVSNSYQFICNTRSSFKGR